MVIKVNSLSTRNALKALGANIKTARKKRRISIEGFGERVGVSKSTIIRLEKGDGGISIGTLAMACLVLGELELITKFLDPGTDDTGLLMERQNLPKRINSNRKGKPKLKDGQKISPPTDTNDDGVGF
jgi:transcriptional regulator with XRE-family HTH domain